MKIVIATPLFPPDIGRPAEYVKELAKRLAGRCSVTVVAYGSLPEQVPGAKVVTVPKNWPIPLRMVAFTWRLWRELKGAQAVWVCDGASVGLPSATAARLRGIPMIRHMLMDEAAERVKFSGRRSRLIEWLQGFVLKQARRVVVPTGALRDASLAYVPASRMIVVPYPGERLQTLPFKVEREPFKILAHGQSLTADDAGILVTAIRSLAGAYPGIRLTMTGEGSAVEGTERLGYVSRAEWSFLLRSCSALVLGRVGTDLHEAVCAAFAAGIPVIAADAGHNREAIGEGGAGILVPPGDADALAEAIGKAVGDQAHRDLLEDVARRRLESYFGWDAHLGSFNRAVEATE